MKLLCYGDSNTYGYDGAMVFGGRFAPELCWPALLGRALGCETVNCGLNGRRVPRFERQIETDLALLRRHAPGDVVIVMLGTNDLLTETSPEDTAAHMRAFLKALMRQMPESAVLLCAPPSAAAFDPGYAEGFETLAALYGELAEELGVLFADASRWGIPMGPDGVHFTERGHRLFAAKMSQTLRMLMR